MRPRKKKHAEERMEKVKHFFISSDENGKPLFPSGYDSINLEIGCGKGTFICETAKKNPESFYLAVEKVPDVILLAMEKADSYNLKNVRFLHGDATCLNEILPAEAIDCLYINFCDPWPKKRNAKRRLTFRNNLNKYRALLRPNGRIFFKTDNRPLFDYSLEEFKAAGYILKNVCFDLHSSEYSASNIMTEYEKNFSEKGFKINRLEAYMDE